MSKIFTPENVVGVWSIFCLVSVIAFIFILVRFLIRNTPSRNSRRNTERQSLDKTISLICLCGATSLLAGCDTKAPLDNLRVKSSANAAEFTTRPLNENDKGGPALVFQRQEEADVFVAELQKVLANESNGESLNELAHIQAPANVVAAFDKDDSLVWRANKPTGQTYPTQNTGFYLVQNCIDWYGSDGEYWGETCGYTYEYDGGSGSGGSTGNSGSGAGSNGSGATGSNGNPRPVPPNGMANFSVHYAGLTNIDGTISLRNGQLSNITTVLSGLTYGIVYTQTGFVQDAYTSRTIDFTVSYSLTLTMFINGIGNVYTYPIQDISFRLDRQTGRVTRLH